MTRLLVTKPAENDVAELIAHLTAVAGPRVAERYAKSLRATLQRLLAFPRSGAPRKNLGNATRIAVISPYVLIYDYNAEDDVVVFLRILHGRRDIAKLLSRR